MYQALQNGMFGFGAICGASFGGSIADGIGWRWCFILQVPISAFALFVGALVINNPGGGFGAGLSFKETWARVDFTGAFLLVIAISVQLVGLSLGGNELPWSSPWVIGSLLGSFVLLGLFLVVEAKTRAIPVIPLRLLHGSLPGLTQLSNICVGMSAYAVSKQRSSDWRDIPDCPTDLGSTCSTSRSSSRLSCWIPQQRQALGWRFRPWQRPLEA